MDAREAEKRAAAEAAVAEVEDGMRLGLGTGSTVLFLLKALGARVRGGLRVVGVPTSTATARVAAEEGIPLDDLDREPRLDLTIDGADEIDPALRLVKGGGGALLREKIVASASERMVVVADASKVVDRLGAFPLPVEVIPFAASLVTRKVKDLGAEPRLRLAKDGSPFVTDEGNRILDCAFGWIRDPERMAATLSGIPGVVEHGLFLGLASEALVARGGDVRRLTRPRRRYG